MKRTFDHVDNAPLPVSDTVIEDRVNALFGGSVPTACRTAAELLRAGLLSFAADDHRPPDFDATFPATRALLFESLAPAMRLSLARLPDAPFAVCTLDVTGPTLRMLVDYTERMCNTSNAPWLRAMLNTWTSHQVCRLLYALVHVWHVLSRDDPDVLLLPCVESMLPALTALPDEAVTDLLCLHDRQTLPLIASINDVYFRRDAPVPAYLTPYIRQAYRQMESVYVPMAEMGAPALRDLLWEPQREGVVWALRRAAMRRVGGIFFMPLGSGKSRTALVTAYFAPMLATKLKRGPGRTLIIVDKAILETKGWFEEFGIVADAIAASGLLPPKAAIFESQNGLFTNQEDRKEAFALMGQTAPPELMKQLALQDANVIFTWKQALEQPFKESDPASFANYLGGVPIDCVIIDEIHTYAASDTPTALQRAMLTFLATVPLCYGLTGTVVNNAHPAALRNQMRFVNIAPRDPAASNRDTTRQLLFDETFRSVVRLSFNTTVIDVPVTLDFDTEGLLYEALDAAHRARLKRLHKTVPTNVEATAKFLRKASISATLVDAPTRMKVFAFLKRKVQYMFKQQQQPAAPAPSTAEGWMKWAWSGAKQLLLGADIQPPPWAQPDFEYEPTRYKVLLQEIRTIQQQTPDVKTRIIVVAYYVDVVDTCAAFLATHLGKAQVGRYRGDASTRARDNTSFLSDDADSVSVLVVTIDSYNKGVNAKGVYHMFFLEPEYNPVKQSQMMARILRDKPHIPRFYYRLFSANTYDAKILDICDQRLAANSAEMHALGIKKGQEHLVALSAEAIMLLEQQKKSFSDELFAALTTEVLTVKKEQAEVQAAVEKAFEAGDAEELVEAVDVAEQKEVQAMLEALTLGEDV